MAVVVKRDMYGYSAHEAARDARAGACFVAWPADEDWQVPVVMCV